MTLDKIFSKLQGNLFKPYLFYFPSSIIPESKKKIVDNPAANAFFDCILYVDKKGEPFTVISTESIYPLLTKTVILEKNMFLLLEQKRKLSTTELNFLLEKYCESLNFYVLASIWMHTNLGSLKTKISQDVAVYFETQNQAFQNHENEFKKYFPKFNSDAPKTPPIDWSKFNKSDFPPLEQLANKEIDLSSILKTDKKPGVKKAKKPPLITDEQSRLYLLESVFKVKFN
jgi:hypothetical protein